MHQCYGTELGLTSEDDDYVSPSTEHMNGLLWVLMCREMLVGGAGHDMCVCVTARRVCAVMITDKNGCVCVRQYCVIGILKCIVYEW